ncbi:MAG: AraC family transcriptional regulator [Tannerella sp.]|jgi:AraC-like DNA-binding protein|nr:AraC family transcriptional regulator [Tannerella sp.]
MEKTTTNIQATTNKHIPVIAKYYNYNRFTYPRHFHDEFEIIYIKEGSGDRLIADNIERFSPGDLILLGSNLPHYIKSDDIYFHDNSTLRVKGVIVWFAHDYMSYAINNYTALNHVKNLLDEANRGIYFPAFRNKEIIDIIEKIPTYKDFDLIMNLLFLLDKMATTKNRRLLASPNFNEKRPKFFDDRIEKIVSYLNYHYKENLKLETIASEIPMSASAFCRYFKEKTGKSCIEYMQGLRIGYACKLLSETSHDIFQISIECGFNTPCHFNKIFKRKTGLSPSEYRNKITKQFEFQ